MGDDKSKRGKTDRAFVSGAQRYEVDYLAKKTGLPATVVRKVIAQHGPDRKEVERYLDAMKSSPQ